MANHYSKRYAGGFIDANSSYPVDAQFLNAVETALLLLNPSDPTANYVPVWDGSKFAPALVKNVNVDSAAAIARSKLDFGGGLVDSDIAAAAAIAYSKLSLAGAIKKSDLAVTGTPDGTKFMRDDYSWQSVSSTTYRKNTAKAVTNTTVETDLFNGELTLAANAMGTDRVMRIHAHGDWNPANAGTLAGVRWKFKLGTTVIIDTGAPASMTNGAVSERHSWVVDIVVVETGATNSQSVIVKGWMEAPVVSNGSGNFTTGEGEYFATGKFNTFLGWNSATIDTTASQAIVLSIINPTATTYEVILKGALVVIE